MSVGHAAVGSPSELARTVQCPRSVALCAPFANAPPSEEILEGNVGDWVAEQYHRGKLLFVGTRSPVLNGPVVDDEMIRGALLWRSIVPAVHLAPPQVPVSCAPIHPLSWGTPDCQWWDAEQRIFNNYDYKYGHLIHDPFEHWQSIGYVAGALAQLDLLGDPTVRVRIWIIQPRNYQEPVRCWELTVGELRTYINIASAAVYESLLSDATARTGHECLTCDARHVCSTLQNATNRIVEFAGRADPVNMRAEAIGAELKLINDALVLLKARSTGLEEQVKANWFAGKPVPGWMLRQSMSRLTWNRGASEVIAACDAQQIDVRKSPHPELITPTQAMQRGLDEKIANTLASRSAGEWQVIRDDGKEARKRFKNL